MSFLTEFNDLISHNKSVSNPVSSVTLAVTEKTVRRVLKIRKKEPLQYAGIAIKCIGSKKWRAKHAGN